MPKFQRHLGELIQTVSFNRRETNALLQVFANTGFGPGLAFPKQTQRLPHHAYYSANSLMCEKTGAALEYCHLKIGANSKLWLESASKEIGRLAQGSAAVKVGTNTIHFIHAHKNHESGKQLTSTLWQTYDHKKKTHITSDLPLAGTG